MSMLPDRAARAFPLLLLGLMAGMAVMLDRVTEVPSFAPGAADRTPDLRISHFAAIGHGEDGKPLYQLKADQMRHYPNDGRSEFERASLQRTLPGEPSLSVQADKATANASGDQLWFERDVLLARAAGDTPAVQLRTSRLQLDARLGQASSDAPTKLQMGADQASSTGFHYDHDQARLKLSSKVSIDYAPPKR